MEETLGDFEADTTLVDDCELGLARDALTRRWYHRLAPAKEVLTAEIAATLRADFSGFADSRERNLELSDVQKRRIL